MKTITITHDLRSKEWEDGYRNGNLNTSRFGDAWAASVMLWKTPTNDYERGYLQAIQEACERFWKRREARA